MKSKGYISVRGDYGNPAGTGLAKIVVDDLVVEAYTDVQSKLGAFHAALKTAQFTATNIGDVINNYQSESAALAPAADVNIDRKLVATWRTTSDSSTRRITVPGIPAVSTGIDKLPAGERLNDVGKAALAAALEALYGLTAGEVIVLQGKVLQPA